MVKTIFQFISLTLILLMLSGCNGVRTQKVDLTNQQLIEEAKEVAENRTKLICIPNIEKSFVEPGGKEESIQIGILYLDLYYYRFDCDKDGKAPTKSYQYKPVYITCEYMDLSGTSFDARLRCY